MTRVGDMKFQILSYLVQLTHCKNEFRSSEIIIVLTGVDQGTDAGDVGPGAVSDGVGHFQNVPGTDFGGEPAVKKRVMSSTNR